MEERYKALHEAMQKFGFGGLTQEQKEDIRFRLLMGETTKSVANRYKVSAALVYEVKTGVR